MGRYLDNQKRVDFAIDNVKKMIQIEDDEAENANEGSKIKR